jgi:hypothetical protein
MNRKLVIAFLFGIALTLQAVNSYGAQRKEGPTSAPVSVSADAQRKEAPTIRPITTVVIDWLSRIRATILPGSQHKE